MLETAFWKKCGKILVFGAYKKVHFSAVFHLKKMLKKRRVAVSQNQWSSSMMGWFNMNHHSIIQYEWSKWPKWWMKNCLFCYRKVKSFVIPFQTRYLTWYILLSITKNAFVFAVTTRVSYPTQMDYYSQGMKCCDILENKSQNL